MAPAPGCPRNARRRRDFDDLQVKDRGLLETRKYGHVRLFSVESINKLISRSRNSVNRTAFLEHGYRG